MAETAQWIDPYGQATDLRVLFETEGRFMPPSELDEETAPGQPGAFLHDVEHGVREMALPIVVSADSAAELRTSLRTLNRAMDPKRGDGILRMSTPAGDQRDLVCRVVAGLDAKESLGDTATPTDQLLTLVIRAHDPYWTDVNEITQQFGVATAPSFFPFFPLRLAASEIAVDTTVDNEGDVDCWPTWQIDGPGGVISIRNLTTNKRLTFNTTTLADGEFITITTTPGQKSVLKSDGTNLFSDLITTSSYFPLIPGPNAIRLEMSGLSSTLTPYPLTLRYKQRYLTV